MINARSLAAVERERERERLLTNSSLTFRTQITIGKVMHG